MLYKIPGICPICESNMTITKVVCNKCNTEISGNFAPCHFCALDDKSINFLEVFLRNRGNIKDVEKELGISYPTVRNNLDALLETLNLNNSQKTFEISQPTTHKQVLEKVNNGELSTQEAVIILKKLGKGV